MSKSTWTGGAVLGRAPATGARLAYRAQVGRHNSHRGCGRFGLDRDGQFDHQFVRPPLQRAETNTVAAFLDNSGDLRVDCKGGAGGTILNIGGTLTNSGDLSIGNATLAAPDTVSAASLDNTGRDPPARLRLQPGAPRCDRALRGIWHSGSFERPCSNSTGDSAIEFKSGEITSLARSAQLRLNGNDAFIEDTAEWGRTAL